MFAALFAICLALLAIEVQVDTQVILDMVPSVRLAVMASQERCPTLFKGPACRLEVSAKRGTTWEHCDKDHPPSGADLPMHRWFLVSGHCKFSVAGFDYKIPFPEQKILR